MHRGNEIVDHPYLAGGLHAANYIEIHCWRGRRRRDRVIRVRDAGRGTVPAGDVGQPGTDETGWTPIPPLNCNGVSAAAGSEQTTPSNIVHAKTVFMILPLKLASRRAQLLCGVWQDQGGRKSFGLIETICRSLWRLSDRQRPTCPHLAPGGQN
jgi:hypothetical protein